MDSSTPDNILSDLQSLYAQLPPVDCQACGSCCVSPTCTLVEFAQLIRGSQLGLEPQVLAERICRPPKQHPAHEGNLVCRFLESGHCLVHGSRTGACRLFGMPALRNLGIENMEYCAHKPQESGTAGEAAFVRGWLERLMALNERVYHCAAEPYFLRGLNLECWLDLYFDPTLDFDIFAPIMEFMETCFDLSHLRGAYTLSTGIREKIDKIGVLQVLVGTGDSATIEKVLRSLTSDYPLTGTYYHAESHVYLETLRGGKKA